MMTMMMMTGMIMVIYNTASKLNKVSRINGGSGDGSDGDATTYGDDNADEHSDDGHFGDVC